MARADRSSSVMCVIACGCLEKIGRMYAEDSVSDVVSISDMVDT